MIELVRDTSDAAQEEADPIALDYGLLPGIGLAPQCPAKESTAWLPTRVARLGFLLGCNYTAPMVATAMGITVHNAYRTARRFGLSFREGHRARKTSGTRRVSGAISQAAAKYGISIGELEDTLLSLIDADPCLLENILDGDLISGDPSQQRDRRAAA